MNDFAAATGRQYKPFEFYGHPQAERVIVIMGSAIGTCEEVVDELLSRGEKVGVLKVRLYRPFSAAPAGSLPKAPAPWRYWIAPKNRAPRLNRCIST
jgi:pyruvate/2-oxoacid:ferredoxin oxidoreductase alpha subunit